MITDAALRFGQRVRYQDLPAQIIDIEFRRRRRTRVQIRILVDVDRKIRRVDPDELTEDHDATP